MKQEIRRARHEDAAHIITAHQRSIREICSKDYSPEQIEAWAGRDFHTHIWHKTMDKDLVWVISDTQNSIFGFGHLDIRKDFKAEIAGLYFAPEVAGLGFGKKLVQLMFDECRKQNIQEVNLCATKTAKSFYEKVGFTQVGPAGEIKIGGKSLECYFMTRSVLSKVSGFYVENPNCHPGSRGAPSDTRKPDHPGQPS